MKFISVALFGLTFAVGAGAQNRTDIFLSRAKSSHSLAPNYGQWSHSDYGLEAAVRFVMQEIANGRTESVCAALSRQNEEDLYYFSQALQIITALPECLRHQADRYERYLKSKQFSLYMNAVGGLTMGKSTGLPPAGPSMEIFVDPASTPVLFDGGVPEKTLVLTFDDGPHAVLTEKLLEILKSENLQVNFFLVGRNTNLYQEVVQRQHAARHEIGCHSFTHADLRKLSLKDAIAEIEDGFTAIITALGIPGAFFRFPYGANTLALRRHLEQTNTAEFLWNIDTLDWKYKDPEFLLDYSLRQVSNEGRGIVLFHDIQPQTIAMLPAFLSELKLKKYKFAVMRPLTPRRVKNAH